MRAAKMIKGSDDPIPDGRVGRPMQDVLIAHAQEITQVMRQTAS